MNSNHRTPLPAPTARCRALAGLLPLLDAPDTDAAAAAEARAHLDGCAYCQAQRAAYRRLDAAARRYLAPPAISRYHTEDLMSDILQEAPAEPTSEPVYLPLTPVPVPTLTREPGRPRRFLSGLASLAAVLVIVIIAAVLFTGHRQSLGSNSGLSWTASESGLSDIAMVSPTEGWAIGATTTCYVYDANLETHYSNADCSQRGALLMHYHQGVWSRVALSIPGQLQSISMDSATDGWAVGVANTPGFESILLHYDGQTWQEVPNQLNIDLTRVQMLSATDGWAIGMGSYGASLLHYDGQSWTVQPWPASLGIESKGRIIINDLEMLSPTEGWAAGWFAPLNSDGTKQEALILHYSGGQWTVSGTFEYGGLDSIAMTSPTDGWAVGWRNVETQWLANGTPQTVWVNRTPQTTIEEPNSLALHYTHGTWQPVDVSFSKNQEHVRQVFLSSATNGWMVGSMPGVLLHYQGKAWQQVHLRAIKDTLLDLSRLDMLSAVEGWAVGSKEAARGCMVAPPPDGGVEVCSTPLLLHYQHNAWTIYNI